MIAAAPIPIGGVATTRKGRPVKAATATPSTAGFLLHCVSACEKALAQPMSETTQHMNNSTILISHPLRE